MMGEIDKRKLVHGTVRDLETKRELGEVALEFRNSASKHVSGFIVSPGRLYARNYARPFEYEFVSKDGSYRLKGSGHSDVFGVSFRVARDEVFPTKAN